MGMYGWTVEDGVLAKADDEGVLHVVKARFGVPIFERYFDVNADTVGESATKQEFVDECDINNIMAQYQKSGIVSHVAKYQGRYDDVSDAVEYHEAQNVLLAAQAAFMSLPSSVRDDFQNDPAKFLDFVHDPKNKEKMREYGLLKENVDGTIQEVKPKSAGSGVDAGESDGAVAGSAKSGSDAGGK